jgi:hypothetical protein
MAWRFAENDELSISGADSGDGVRRDIQEVGDGMRFFLEIFVEEGCDKVVLEVEVTVLGVEVKELSEKVVLFEFFIGLSGSDNVEAGLDF